MAGATETAVKDSSDATDIEEARAEDENKVEGSLKDHNGAVDSPYTGPICASRKAGHIRAAVIEHVIKEQANFMHIF